LKKFFFAMARMPLTFHDISFTIIVFDFMEHKDIKDFFTSYMCECLIMLSSWSLLRML